MDEKKREISSHVSSLSTSAAGPELELVTHNVTFRAKEDDDYSEYERYGNATVHPGVNAVYGNPPIAEEEEEEQKSRWAECKKQWQVINQLPWHIFTMRVIFHLGASFLSVAALVFTIQVSNLPGNSEIIFPGHFLITFSQWYVVMEALYFVMALWMDLLPVEQPTKLCGTVKPILLMHFDRFFGVAFSFGWMAGFGDIVANQAYGVEFSSDTEQFTKGIMGFWQLRIVIIVLVFLELLIIPHYYRSMVIDVAIVFILASTFIAHEYVGNMVTHRWVYNSWEQTRPRLKFGFLVIAVVLLYLLGRILTLCVNKIRQRMWTKWPDRYNYLRLEYAALMEDEQERQKALKATAEAALRALGVTDNLQQHGSSQVDKKLYVWGSDPHQLDGPDYSGRRSSLGAKPGVLQRGLSAPDPSTLSADSETDGVALGSTEPHACCCCQNRRRCKQCNTCCYLCSKRLKACIQNFFHNKVVGSLTAREAVVPILCSLTISLLVLYAFLVSYLLLPQVEIRYHVASSSSPSP